MVSRETGVWSVDIFLRWYKKSVLSTEQKTVGPLSVEASVITLLSMSSSIKEKLTQYYLNFRKSNHLHRFNKEMPKKTLNCTFRQDYRLRIVPDFRIRLGTV